MNKLKLIFHKDPDIKLQIDSIRRSEKNPELGVILLKEETGKRFLPVWATNDKTSDLISRLRETSIDPSDFYFTVMKFMKLGSLRIEKLVITEIQQNRFFAKLFIRKTTWSFSGPFEVDCSPSEGIILATLYKAPIYARVEVMEKAGVEDEKKNDNSFGENAEKLGYTNSAQATACMVKDILDQYHQAVIQNEHIFLALLDLPDGSLKTIFDTLGMNRGEIAEEVIPIIQGLPRRSAGQNLKGQIFISTEAKISMDNAAQEAKKVNAELISPVHILIGLLQTYWSSDKEQKTICGRLLQKIDLTPEKVRKVL